MALPVTRTTLKESSVAQKQHFCCIKTTPKIPVALFAKSCIIDSVD